MGTSEDHPPNRRPVCSGGQRSRLGTRLNNQPVQGPTPLKDGDVIKFGTNFVRFNERHKRAGQPESGAVEGGFLRPNRPPATAANSQPGERAAPDFGYRTAETRCIQSGTGPASHPHRHRNGLRFWVLGLGTSDLGPRVNDESQDQRPKTKDQRPKTKDQRPKTKDAVRFIFQAIHVPRLAPRCQPGRWAAVGTGGGFPRGSSLGKLAIVGQNRGGSPDPRRHGSDPRVAFGG